jgi:hypothetical protein
MTTLTDYALAIIAPEAFDAPLTNGKPTPCYKGLYYTRRDFYEASKTGKPADRALYNEMSEKYSDRFGILPSDSRLKFFREPTTFGTVLHKLAEVLVIEDITFRVRCKPYGESKLLQVKYNEVKLFEHELSLALAAKYAPDLYALKDVDVNFVIEGVAQGNCQVLKDRLFKRYVCDPSFELTLRPSTKEEQDSHKLRHSELRNAFIQGKLSESDFKTQVTLLDNELLSDKNRYYTPRERAGEESD